MQILRNKSLRIRINASILIVCLFISIVTILTVVPYENKRKESQHTNIEILLEAVYQQKREALANEMFAGQTMALQKSISDILKVEQIAKVELFELDGKFLIASEIEQAEPFPEDKRLLLEEGNSFSVQEIDDHSYGIFESLIEIIGEEVGYIRIFYDLGDLERQFYLMAMGLIFIFILLIVGGAIVTNRILTHAIIRPTSELSNAIRRVCDGNLGEQVDIESEDEIGSMVADFNDMSKRLSQKNEELLDAIKIKDSFADRLEEMNLELALLNAELEERVNERTAELQRMYEHLSQEMKERQQADEEKRQLQDKLIRSQKMEALGLLAGGVAHDLNNVLSGIVTYPDLLLLKLENDSTLRQPIETIQKSGKKASAIVQDLLALARRGVVTKEVVNINRIVTAYVDSPEYQQVMEYHPGIDVQINLADDLLPILGSSIHIAKSIMNLFSNAAEAQPNGGQIIISTANVYQDIPQQKYEWMDEGEYALLKVSDRGSGIADEDLERIFEPFYTKKNLGRSGTGLGMAVVWGAVQDHNGFIDVKSPPGEGATFELYFPVTRQITDESVKSPSVATLRGNDEIILVVDDVEEQREITCAILTHLNYRTYSVDSGEAAIAFIKANDVDIIVLDMIMDPGIDGLETYSRIKAISPTQKTIIASGFAENERVKEAIRLGAAAFIRKPFTLEGMGLAIKQEVDRASE